MAVYILGQVVVRDMKRFAPYMELTPTLIARHGGEVLDVAQAFDVLEGAWPDGALTALVRFPDETSARAFWNDPENTAMKDLRHETTNSNVALLRSLPMPG
jgi:uncharacterized protein (DUF1330 family)